MDYNAGFELRNLISKLRYKHLKYNIENFSCQTEKGDRQKILYHAVRTILLLINYLYHLTVTEWTVNYLRKQIEIAVKNPVNPSAAPVPAMIPHQRGGIFPVMTHHFGFPLRCTGKTS